MSTLSVHPVRKGTSERRRRGCREHRRALRPLWTMAYALVAASGAGAEAFFAEPFSGKKVSSYEVELPVSRTERRTFRVPADCPAVLEATAAGASRWGSRVERTAWWKVESDCRFHAFLNRHTKPPLRDFVSGYDFMNAYLRDLPMTARCRTPEDAGCTPIPPGVPDISSYLPFVDRGDQAPRLDVSPCRIEHGIFRGRVVQDRTGVHCEPDPDAPGFRVLSVDYADVNGDRYLDVVLRLVPLVPGASRTPVVLPLTRKEPDGVFRVPEALAQPPASQGQ